MQLSLGLPLFLEVAQPGQSPRLGTEMPLVRIQPSRPNTLETRKVGVLIRFEPGDVYTDVGVRSPQSPPMNNGECSLTAKPQTVNLADIGSSPIIHPSPMEKWPSGPRHSFAKREGRAVPPRFESWLLRHIRL